MKKFARLVLTLMLAAVLVAPLMAADKDKKKKKRKKGKKARVVNVVRLPKSVRDTLTDEQKKQIAAINKQYAPKLVELVKKRAGIITPDQRRARAEAIKAARKAGKKGKELRKAVADSVKITDEQKKQMQALRKEFRSLRAEVNKKVRALLTDDQRAKLKPVRKKGKGKKARKRKKKNADK